MSTAGQINENSIPVKITIVVYAVCYAAETCIFARKKKHTEKDTSEIWTYSE